MDYTTALRVLELEANATEDEAAKAYKDLIRVWHPDHFAHNPDLQDRATAKTRALNEAWEVFQQGAPRTLAPQKPRTRHGATLLTVLGAVLALAILAFLLVTDAFDPELRLEKTLTGMAYVANKSLPLELDSETLLTATFAGPGRRFTYVYHIKNYSREQVGAAYFEQVRQGLEASFRAKGASDRNLRFFGEQGVTLNYSFKDQAGADIMTLTFGPDQYKVP